VSTLSVRLARLEQRDAGCAVCRGLTPIALVLPDRDGAERVSGQPPCPGCGRGIRLVFAPYERVEGPA